MNSQSFNKDEMYQELTSLIKTINDGYPKPTSKMNAFAHSPFVVTVLGGVLITGMSLLIQNKSAHNERRIQVWQAKLEKKQDTVEQFARGFPLSLVHSYQFLKVWIWKNDLENGTETERGNALYDGHRTYAETTKYYEELREKYNQNSPEIYPVLVQSAFESDNTRVHAKNLTSEIDKMFSVLKNDIPLKKDVLTHYKKCTDLHLELLKLMSDEINNDLKTLEQ